MHSNSQNTLLDQNVLTESKGEQKVSLNEIEDNLSKYIKKLPKSISSNILSTIKILKILSEKVPIQYKDDLNRSVVEIVRKTVQPQISSFSFHKGNNANLYPIFGVIAWQNEQLGYATISWRLCSWVESGGVRCIPIVEKNLQQESDIQELKSHLQNIHGLIIPQNDNKNSLKYIHNLMDLLRQFQKPLFVLSFGNPSKIILQQRYQNLLMQQKSRAGHIQGKIISLCQSKIFSSIDSVLQLKTLSTTTTHYSSCFPQINWQELQKFSKELSIESFILATYKDSFQLKPYCLGQKFSTHVQIYHCFLQIYNQSSPLSTQFFNKAIVNFVDLAKEKPHNVKPPQKYIAHYPLQFKDSPHSAHYKINITK